MIQTIKRGNNKPELYDLTENQLGWAKSEKKLYIRDENSIFPIGENFVDKNPVYFFRHNIKTNPSINYYEDVFYPITFHKVGIKLTYKFTEDMSNPGTQTRAKITFIVQGLKPIQNNGQYSNSRIKARYIFYNEKNFYDFFTGLNSINNLKFLYFRDIYKYPSNNILNPQEYILNSTNIKTVPNKIITFFDFPEEKISYKIDTFIYDPREEFDNKNGRELLLRIEEQKYVLANEAII